MDLPYRGKVFSADGKEIGILRELVIDPRSRVITHLVIQKGLLFASDRLLSTEYIDRVEDENVMLTLRADQIEESEAPEYREREFIPIEDEDVKGKIGQGGRIWVRPPEASTGDYPYQSIIPPGIGPIVPEHEPPIPLDEITLERGSVVRASDGKEIGTVLECRVDDQEKLTHILIKEGVFFGVPKLIPIDWVKTSADNEIVLSVTSVTVRKLG